MGKNRGRVLDLQQQNDEATHYHESLEHSYSVGVVSDEFVASVPSPDRLRRPLKRVPLLEHEVVKPSDLENEGSDPEINQCHVRAECHRRMQRVESPASETAECIAGCDRGRNCVKERGEALERAASALTSLVRE